MIIRLMCMFLYCGRKLEKAQMDMRGRMSCKLTWNILLPRKNKPHKASPSPLISLHKTHTHNNPWRIHKKFLTKITCDLLNAACAHVEQHAAVDDATPQLKQTVQGEGGHVGFAPPFAPIFHVFFKFQPPVRGRREAEEFLIPFE